MTESKPISRQGNAVSVALDVQNLSKSYGGNEVLHDISFKLYENEILGVIGPSGGGKTTLLKCLNLLESFNSGSIEFHRQFKVSVNEEGILGAKDGSSEVVLTEERISKIRQEVGFVFQSFNLWEEKTVIENLILGPIVVLKQRRKSAIERASLLCRQFGLEGKVKARIWQLSGGQRQRVAIIRALMMSPKIILLDEITSALDPVLTIEVLQAIRKLREQGLAMILVTHHIEFASSLCDRMMFLSDGRILQTDTAGDLRKKPASQQVRSFLEILRAIQ